MCYVVRQICDRKLSHVVDRFRCTLLLLVLVTGFGVRGDESAIQDATGSEAAQDAAGNSTKAHTFSDQTLQMIERSLPSVHQALITDKWQSMDAFTKYRLVSPQLLKQWGRKTPANRLTRRMN